jgi:hypothetical protein
MAWCLVKHRDNFTFTFYFYRDNFTFYLLRGRKWREADDCYNVELHNLYALPNFIRVIKSRRMRWAEHVALMGEIRNVYKYCSENLKEETTLET